MKSGGGHIKNRPTKKMCFSLRNGVLSKTRLRTMWKKKSIHKFGIFHAGNVDALLGVCQCTRHFELSHAEEHPTIQFLVLVKVYNENRIWCCLFVETPSGASTCKIQEKIRVRVAGINFIGVDFPSLVVILYP